MSEDWKFQRFVVFHHSGYHCKLAKIKAYGAKTLTPRTWVSLPFWWLEIMRIWTKCVLNGLRKRVSHKLLVGTLPVGRNERNPSRWFKKCHGDDFLILESQCKCNWVTWMGKDEWRIATININWKKHHKTEVAWWNRQNVQPIKKTRTYHISSMEVHHATCRLVKEGPALSSILLGV